MTCIVGVIESGRTWIGADALAVGGGRGTFVISPGELHVRYDPGADREQQIRYPTTSLFQRGRAGLCEELIKAMASVIEARIAEAQATLEAL